MYINVFTCTLYLCNMNIHINKVSQKPNFHQQYLCMILLGRTKNENERGIKTGKNHIQFIQHIYNTLK